MDIIKQNNRFVIIDENKKVVDDANGYGFKTYQNAQKAMWYKFKGGKEKLNEIEQFWKEHYDIKRYYEKLLETYLKEICRGETLISELINDTNKHFNIVIPKNYFNQI